jgi:hypothetical protein
MEKEYNNPSFATFRNSTQKIIILNVYLGTFLNFNFLPIPSGAQNGPIMFLTLSIATFVTKNLAPRSLAPDCD